jgi:hypothetical protein
MAVQFRLPLEALLSTSVANLNSGTVSFYEDGTLVATTVYADSDRGTPTGVAGVVTLDSVGQHGPVYLPDAIVRVIVKNSSGSTVANGDFDVDGRDTQERQHTIKHVVDGGGSVPGTGVTGDAMVTHACTIVAWSVLADQSGSMETDVWIKPYVANSPPTVANTVVASDYPKITTASSADGSALTGWTTAIAANSQVRFNLRSITTITRFTITLHCERILDR